MPEMLASPAVRMELLPLLLVERSLEEEEEIERTQGTGSPAFKRRRIQESDSLKKPAARPAGSVQRAGALLCRDPGKCERLEASQRESARGPSASGVGPREP